MINSPFTPEQAEALMTFIAQNGWANNERIVRVELWSSFPRSSQFLQNYLAPNSDFIRGYYDSADATFYVQGFRIGKTEWSEPTRPRLGE